MFVEIILPRCRRRNDDETDALKGLTEAMPTPPDPVAKDNIQAPSSRHRNVFCSHGLHAARIAFYEPSESQPTHAFNKSFMPMFTCFHAFVTTSTLYYRSHASTSSPLFAIIWFCVQANVAYRHICLAFASKICQWGQRKSHGRHSRMLRRILLATIVANYRAPNYAQLSQLVDNMLQAFLFMIPPSVLQRLMVWVICLR